MLRIQFLVTVLTVLRDLINDFVFNRGLCSGFIGYRGMELHCLYHLSLALFVLTRQTIVKRQLCKFRMGRGFYFGLWVISIHCLESLYLLKGGLGGRYRRVNSH